MTEKTPTANKRRWIMLIALFTLHFSFFVSPVGAQTFTQRIQQSQQGEGTLRIHHDATIDELVNGPKQTQKVKPAEKKKEKKKEEKKQKEPVNHQRVTPQQEEQPVDTLSQKNKRTRKAMGFRIQVFEGGSSRQDRIKAEHTRNALKGLFPTEPIYVHYSKPRWLCRVGDYVERADAEHMLIDIRKAGYPNATIVRDRVYVPY